MDRKGEVGQRRRRPDVRDLETKEKKGKRNGREGKRDMELMNFKAKFPRQELHKHL